ncbi:Ig-like domain-containing protein [Mycobacterium sp. B14F4]|uniref:YVTN family beta-propeller repeat protein n=1 Tax=Mycobacterium sp. B14F4 TaxID=3153565 RepID=UPI00325F5FB9
MNALSRVLSMVGLGAIAGDIPAGPGESPLLLALLGWARKQSEYNLTEDEATESPLAATSTDDIDDAPTTSAALGADSTLGTTPMATPAAPAESPGGPLAPDDTTGMYSVASNQVADDAGMSTAALDPESSTAAVSDSQVAATAVFETESFLPAPSANQAPAVGDTTLSTPNQATGVITGSVTATDPDGDSLTYTVPTQPSLGVVSVNADGTFTFTPTVAARLAAAQTVGADTDSFTVAVGDGTAITTTTVTVAVLPANIGSSIASATTGTTPMGVAVVADRAYVANQGASTVSVIDTTTNTVVKTIAVGTRPTGVTVSPDQTKVYVANSWSNTVSVIDTTTNAVTATIAVGSGPVALAVSPDGTRLYVANISANTVSVVDTATRTVISTVRVGSYPNGVAVSPDGTRVYVTNKYSYTVSVIDTSTNTVAATVRVGYTPSAVTVGATRAVVTNQSGNSITVINTTTATPTVITTITLPTGAAPTSVVLSKDNTLAYVANSNDTISVIDLTTATPKVVRTIKTDPTAENSSHTLTLSPDGTRLYLTDAYDKTLRSLSLVRGNTPPVADAPSQTSVDSATGVVTGRLNFTDTDGDPLSYTVLTPLTSGTVTVNPATGTYTFTPTEAARDAAAATPGTDSVTFSVTANDGTATSVPVSVTAPVTPLQPGDNRAPVVGTPTVTSQDPITGMVTGLLNFTDPNGDSLTYAVLTQPPSGSVTADDTAGTFTFTPTQAARDAAAATPGTDWVTFTVAANDGKAAPVTQSITTPILPTPGANQPPEGTPSVTSQDLITGVVTGQLNFTDPNGDSLTYTVPTQPSLGVVSVNADGTFTFTPTVAARLAAAQTVGADTDSFTVAVGDGTAITTTTVTVAVLPANIGSSIASATTGTTPMGVAVVADRAYVANQGASTVSVIDTTTNTVVKTIAVGTRPTGVTVSPDQTKVYVANSWSNTVSVIDTTTNAVTATIAVGSGPVALAVSPDGTRLYVANISANTVSVVDTATRTVISTVRVGSYPNGVAVSPDGTRVYVTNKYSYTVSVIDTLHQHSGGHRAGRLHTLSGNRGRHSRSGDQPERQLNNSNQHHHCHTNGDHHDHLAHWRSTDVGGVEQGQHARLRSQQQRHHLGNRPDHGHPKSGTHHQDRPNRRKQLPHPHAQPRRHPPLPHRRIRQNTAITVAHIDGDNLSRCSCHSGRQRVHGRRHVVLPESDRTSGGVDLPSARLHSHQRQCDCVGSGSCRTYQQHCGGAESLVDFRRSLLHLEHFNGSCGREIVRRRPSRTHRQRKRGCRTIDSAPSTICDGRRFRRRQSRGGGRGVPRRQRRDRQPESRHPVRYHQRRQRQCRPGQTEWR